MYIMLVGIIKQAPGICPPLFLACNWEQPLVDCGDHALGDYLSLNFYFITGFYLKKYSKHFSMLRFDNIW